jgi:VIT1/CCC1 family predicted Fe2+/Mn2+ transporter
LTQIQIRRGLSPDLARQVARELTERDVLGAHARDELGLSEQTAARPVQAALTSAATFAIGAAVPLLCALAAPQAHVTWIVSGGSLLCLAALGVAGARLGGAPVLRPTLRVAFWGALAMASTAVIGALVGRTI